MNTRTVPAQRLAPTHNGEFVMSRTRLLRIFWIVLLISLL